MNKVQNDSVIQQKKKLLRQQMLRILQENTDEFVTKSRRIQEHLRTLSAFQSAWENGSLMSFVSMPSEADTLPFFSGHSVIVPYCNENNLVPIRIDSLNELEAGYKGIREPQESIRNDSLRQVQPGQITAVLVPGLAFDRFGNRLGRGKGYYDRFLRSLPNSVLTIGLTFEQMILDLVPANENDMPVKIIVTEKQVITPDSVTP